MKFKKYSLKLFKDMALYTGAVPLDDMARMDNGEAQAVIGEMHDFSEQSQEALEKITDYDHNFTQQEMASLLCEYETMVEKILNE